MSWSGSDDPGGSGIGSYNIYVSDNGGPWTVWQQNTTATSAVYDGTNGHTYAFYSQATDNVGNVEAPHATADTSTTVELTEGTMTSVSSDFPSGSTYGQSVQFTATVSAAAGTPSGSVQFEIDGVNFGSPVTLVSGSASFSTSALARPATTSPPFIRPTAPASRALTTMSCNRSARPRRAW